MESEFPSMKTGEIMDGSMKSELSSMKTGKNVDGKFKNNRLWHMVFWLSY